MEVGEVALRHAMREFAVGLGRIGEAEGMERWRAGERAEGGGSLVGLTTVMMVLMVVMFVEGRHRKNIPILSIKQQQQQRAQQF